MGCLDVGGLDTEGMAARLEAGRGRPGWSGEMGCQETSVGGGVRGKLGAFARPEGVQDAGSRREFRARS